jgi:hypothetical protein
MKKFKGGLYADLSNYNTTLPNTEILLNFFKSNPIGYRSGGMVRGIAGGNPTGMRVTGGFLANAQKFAQGSSAYYPFDLLDKDYYTPGDRYVDPLTKTQISSYYKKPERLEKLLREKKIDIKRPQGTFVPSTSPITKEDLPKWDRRARKFDTDKEKWVKFSKEEKEAAKKKYVDSLTSQYTSIMGGDYKGPSVYEGLPEDIVKEMQEGRISKKGYPGDRSAQRKFHTGPLPQTPQTEQEIWEKENLIPIDEIGTLYNEKEQKNINKAKKNNESSIVDTINNEAGSDDAWSEGKETIKNLKNDLTKVMDGRKKVSEKDSSELNKLIKNMYGGEGKEDAPAWALPLMVAGFTMAASDNPDMLGAAAEGGIAGVDTYIKTKDKKDQKMKDQLDAYLKLEDIDIRKEQMDLSNEQFYTGLEVNTNATIAQLEATISNQNLDRKLAYEQMYQTWEIHESELMYKYDALEWDKLSETMKMKHNALLANAQILKLHAEAEALGLKKPTYDTFNIDGEDVRVAITQKADGSYDIIEIGQPSSASTVLKAFMETFGTTITQKIQDDEFDSNEWTILYDEFKKMVSGENKISEEDKNYKKIETN